MLIQERLQLVLKMHNLTPSSFADQIGVQRSNISHVLNGRNKPSLDFLEKILLNFPRVNAHWLVTGETPKEQVAEALTEESTDKNEILEMNKLSHSGESIVKIVTFYSDKTFEASYPRRGEELNA